MDARTGEVYHQEDADTPLHPASLTKMMTLYLVFEAVKRGNIGINNIVRVSEHAASRPGSSLHLRPGQEMTVQDLILGAAIRSANDATTALAEAVAGDEARFVERMNATAQRMELTGTTFRNTHGLTAKGHLSTARDMSRLGRFLLFDHPEYFALFSRTEVEMGERVLNHTNRRFLRAYDGADGIKTGYTKAAGYNLTASARRGDKHLIVTVFGASSSAARATQVAQLMDAGFARAPADATRVPPGKTPGPKGAFLAGLQMTPDATVPPQTKTPRLRSGLGSVLATGGTSAQSPGTGQPSAGGVALWLFQQ